ncbi:hypothetical protein HELRODRAFT_182778 [Helobdella robusta]|uniref:Uncharacterized protein n=1 Tax=Helobdella robusta TaxID=6412 RepID=T1FIQ1_HELRO|nr:hypothetical protein HELRODRAFT_182778 [Helobdella robusta]ESN90176.1 hypothetical protein HELRODRAFT_182778 [Helobdella robusta]
MTFTRNFTRPSSLFNSHTVRLETFHSSIKHNGSRHSISMGPLIKCSEVSIVPSDNQFTQLGSNFIFTCIISDKLVKDHYHHHHRDDDDDDDVRGWPTMRWKDPNQAVVGEKVDRVYSERIDRQKNKLYVMNVSREDEGSYMCEVKVDNGMMLLDSNKLYIYSEIELKGPDFPPKIMRGHSELLRCEAGDRRKYEKLSGGLRLNDAQPSDAGTYECIAHNVNRGTFNRSRFLYAPVLGHAPSSIRVVKETDAILNCSASSYPPPIYQWFKGDPHRGKLLHKSNTTGSYVIRKVGYDDEGRYTCLVTNQYGRNEVTTDLHVAVPPKVKLSRPRDPVLIGERVMLLCEASSTPMASLSWTWTYAQYKRNITAHLSPTKENGAMSVRGRVSEPTRNDVIIRTDASGMSRLLIESVAKEHGGYYTCVATNMAGTDEMSVHVVVQYPAIITGSQNPVQYAWLGQKRKFSCQAVGFPLPSVLWFKVVPSVPRNILVVNTTINSFTLQTTSNYSNSLASPSIPPITSWVVKYRKLLTSSSSSSSDKDFIIHSFANSNHLEITNLESNCSYLVLVSACNVVGQSGLVKFHVNTKPQPLPPASGGRRGGKDGNEEKGDDGVKSDEDTGNV